MSDLVRYSFDAGLATITMADPPANSLSPELADGLLAAALRAKADRARVIVLRGEGRFFSVGGDLGSMAAAEDTGAFLLELAERAHRFIVELIRSDAVVVSVVQGMAAGIGFPMAAAADIVVAADTAAFNLAYVRVGLSPDGGSSLLVHTLGLHRTLRLALLAETLTAQEAYDAGLVARVVPADELDAAVSGIVSQLLAGSAGALAATKHLVRAAAEASPETALRRESESVSRLGASDDGREGVSAFLEKRAPEFG